MKLSNLVVCGGTCLTVASCGPGVQQTRPQVNSAAVMVLDSVTLSQLPGLSALDAITLRLPQIHTLGTAGGSPGVLLRGADRVAGDSNPDVCVNHAHTVDTCPLSALRAAEVRLIEIYPLGVTSRPGYLAGAHGLILIFTRGSRAQ